MQVQNVSRMLLQMQAANSPITWYCPCTYQLLWVVVHISPKLSHFKLLFACAMVWVFGIRRVLACWFGSNGSFDRKGNTLRCYLRVQCFGFSVLVACWHAGFARIYLSTERVTFYVAICRCTVLGFRDCSHARMLVSPKRVLRSKITGL